MPNCTYWEIDGKNVAVDQLTQNALKKTKKPVAMQTLQANMNFRSLLCK